MCGGAFTGLEKIISARGRATSIGFGAMVLAPEDRKTGEIFREVEPEDLLKYGLIPEFVGRLPVLATLEDLDESTLKRILVEPKNALVKQYHRLFEMESIDLSFADEALGAIARKAIERKTGARGLRFDLHREFDRTSSCGGPFASKESERGHPNGAPEIYRITARASITKSGTGRHLLRCIIAAPCRGGNEMLNPWFSFGLASARRGLEAQSAFVASLLRMVSGGPPEPPALIDNTEQIVNALPEPAPTAPVGRREKGPKRLPGKEKSQIEKPPSPKENSASKQQAPCKDFGIPPQRSIGASLAQHCAGDCGCGGRPWAKREIW